MKKIKRAILSLFFLFLLYQNFDGILISAQVRLPTMAANGQGILPNSWYFQHYFTFFGIFGSKTKFNTTYILRGTATPLDRVPFEPDDDLIELNIHWYETNLPAEASRMTSLRWIHPEVRDSSFARMTAKLMQIHNSSHPENRVRQVFLYRVWWPNDPAGFYARYDEARFRLITTVRSTS